MNTLTFYESIQVAINSLLEGAIDKKAATEIIENAACSRCLACTNLEGGQCG